MINHSDVKFDPGLQASYDLRYGPFEVDACSDDQGYNAYCAVYWSPSNSFTRRSWDGLKVWAHPPHEAIGSALNKASTGYKTDPDHTSALLVLPNWPEAGWWSHLTRSGLYHCVGYYPAGSNIFLNSGARVASEHGTVLAIIGKTWGTGVCIPWSPWPPTQPPTVPYVESTAVDLSKVKLPKVSEALTQEQQSKPLAWLQRMQSCGLLTTVPDEPTWSLTGSTQLGLSPSSAGLQGTLQLRRKPS